MAYEFPQVQVSDLVYLLDTWLKWNHASRPYYAFINETSKCATQVISKYDKHDSTYSLERWTDTTEMKCRLSLLVAG
jgi:hypothetical protein